MPLVSQLNQPDLLLLQRSGCCSPVSLVPANCQHAGMQSSSSTVQVQRWACHALHTQPRHTGTPARSPAHKYTGCCRVIPSFLHLPPPACFSAGCFKNSKNSKSRTEIKNRKLKLAALVLPVRSAARSAAAERCPTKRTARSNGSSKRSKRSERSASPTQHHAPQLQRPLPRHQPSGAP